MVVGLFESFDFGIQVLHLTLGQFQLEVSISVAENPKKLSTKPNNNHIKHTNKGARRKQNPGLKQMNSKKILSTKNKKMYFDSKVDSFQKLHTEAETSKNI